MLLFFTLTYKQFEDDAECLLKQKGANPKFSDCCK